MRYYTLVLLLFFTAVSVMAQPFDDPKFKQKFNKADALMYDGAYLEAMVLFEDLYAYDTTNANLNYHLGVCYLLGKKDHALAIQRLESATRAVSLEFRESDWKERKAPGITYYYLGKAYHYKNEFERAVSNYYSYRSFIDLDDVETYNQVRQQIQWAENAMDLVKEPVNVKVTNLGPEINTKYPEYCPIVSADGKVLIFTSRRQGGTSELKDQVGQYYEDIYVCQRQPDGKWSSPQGIGPTINSTGHEAAIGLSPDGQLLFIYKDDNNNGNIYFSTRNGSEWTAPKPMGSDINTSAWETHATVNATQDLLIFVSNRKGGHGGRDLWFAKKLPTGEWGLAQNMGSVINSQFEEDSPFITADGKTLIFSSQGHTSMGGFDIFRSEMTDAGWSVPENIGYPINTAEDDVFFTLAPDGQTAYYSSRMDGGYGDTDLYKLKLEVKQSSSVAVARGLMKVPAMAYADIKAKIIVKDEGGAQIGIYRPNQTTGFYVVILNPGETYSLSYEADGYDPIVSKVPVSSTDSYEEYDGVLELEEVVFGENILAMQKERDRLNREKEEAAAKAAEDARLAEEAALKAKEQADKDALAAAQREEKRKAEELAEKEKQEAANALAMEQDKARAADLERRKQEAKAKLAEQASLKQAEPEVQTPVLNEEPALAEELASESVEDEGSSEELTELEESIRAEEASKAERDLEMAEAKKAAEATLAAAKEEQEKPAAKVDEIEVNEPAETPVAQEIVEQVVETEQAELAVANVAVEEPVNEVDEEQARLEAAAEEKKRQLQERIQALKDKQQQQAAVKEEVVQPEVEQEVKQEVKEVAVVKMSNPAPQASVDASEIKAKREEMLAKIEQLKKQKTEVEKQKVVDEQAVAAATAKEKEAVLKKQGLEKKSDKTKEEIAALQKALEAVEEQVVSASGEVEMAREKVAEAERKLAEDIAEEKRIADEAAKKLAEAKEAERQIKELEELERKRIEQERLAAIEFEKEQKAEAERAKRELIQLEAIAEQQRQVQAALQAEEKKKREIDAAEKTAFTQEQKLANAVTLEQLRELNQQLIKDNLDLKKQLAVLNEKLDLILARLDYTPDIDKVEMPSNATMENLQQGRRLILRNIFFDYNQAVLRSRSKYELNKLFEFMKSNPTVKIQVSGHTDSRGNDDYNLRLSKDRAQAVVDYLIRNGISSSRLTAVGYGETRPIARNENEDMTDNPIGRQLNRRIEISLPTGVVDGVEVEEIDVPSGARIK